KGRVYRKNPHSLNELKAYICEEIEAISDVEHQSVVHSFTRRCQVSFSATTQHGKSKLLNI
ncbi:hypothetical protein C0J52_20012, partial [Blattella germanica]